MESFGGAAVEQRQQCPVWMQKLEKPLHHEREHFPVKIIEKIPRKYSVKVLFRVLQNGFQEVPSESGLRNSSTIFTHGSAAEAFLFFGNKNLPASQDIFGGNAITFFD